MAAPWLFRGIMLLALCLSWKSHGINSPIVLPVCSNGDSVRFQGTFVMFLWALVEFRGTSHQAHDFHGASIVFPWGLNSVHEMTRNAPPKSSTKILN